MKKYPCKLIQDLMPLYLEKDVSEDSKKIIEEHLKECEVCRLLMKEYSEDELGLNTFSEDLPKANTFKKLMKRLKLWIFAGIAIIFIAIVGVTTLGYKMGEETKGGLLSVNGIVDTYRKHGMILNENYLEAKNNLAFGGVEPSVFTIGKTGDRLLIYMFKSIAERKEATDNVHSSTDKFFVMNNSNAKNAYIVFAAKEIPKTTEDLDRIGKSMNLFSDITFKYLNEGKEIVYKGESKSWEGTITRKYYTNWVTDKQGVLEMDSYDSETPVLEYKPLNTAELGPISIKYTFKNSSGEVTNITLNKDSLIKLGTNQGSGYVPDEKNVYNFTITVNGKTEELVLKQN